MADSLYTLLDVESYQFRVLQILPGEKGSVIQCKLQRHALINPPRYDALSYCWGDEVMKRPIMVDGIRILITENLEDALQHLREKDVELIWADALCINQTDDQEKSFQVRNMKQIYAEAETTYCWLGNGNIDCAATGIRFLCGLQHDASLMDNSPHAGCKFQHTISNSAHFDIDSDSASLIDLDEPAATCHRYEITKQFHALFDLCSRPYWQRRWVIQEITTANCAKIMCGNATMDFDDLMQQLRICLGLSSWTLPHPLYFSLAQISSFRQSYQNGSSLSLCRTLLDTQSYHSKDIRDNIYAILGICSDAQELVPRPSYQQSPELVAVQLTRELIRHHGCLDIIASKPRSASVLLPSWCPDWISVDEACVEIAMNQQSRLLPRGFRSRMLACAVTELHVQGVLLGIVSETTSLLSSSSQHHIPPDKDHSLHDPENKDYYGKDTFTAILECLCSLDWRTSLPRTSFSSQYWFFILTWKLVLFHNAHDLTEPDKTKSITTRWISQNSNFRIAGKRLQNWLRLDPDMVLTLNDCPAAPGGVVLGLIFMGFSVSRSLSRVVSSFAARICAQDLPSWFRLSLNFFLFVVLPTILILVAFWLESGFPRKFRAQVEAVIRCAINDMHSSSRRLMVTRDGMLGMTKADAAKDDQICFIAGCTMAVVLRPTDNGSETRYSVVGPAMVCLNRRDSERYSAWHPKETGPWKKSSFGVRGWFDDSGRFDETLMTKYETYEEWRNFVLI